MRRQRVRHLGRVPIGTPHDSRCTARLPGDSQEPQTRHHTGPARDGSVRPGPTHASSIQPMSGPNPVAQMMVVMPSTARSSADGAAAPTASGSATGRSSGSASSGSGGGASIPCVAMKASIRARTSAEAASPRRMEAARLSANCAVVPSIPTRCPVRTAPRRASPWRLSVWPYRPTPEMVGGGAKRIREFGQLREGLIEETGAAQPVKGVAAAVASALSGDGAGGDHHAAASQQQLFRDLTSRLGLYPTTSTPPGGSDAGSR